MPKGPLVKVQGHSDQRPQFGRVEQSGNGVASVIVTLPTGAVRLTDVSFNDIKPLTANDLVARKIMVKIGPLEGQTFSVRSAIGDFVNLSNGHRFHLTDIEPKE